jgi:sodium-dependent dicarboxylate transporter 2/3/5
MLATASLSMWISNTATTVMMLPLAIAVISNLSTDDKSRFAKAMMLSIAYAASIGGIATLIGTPTNLVLTGVLEKLYNTEISFVNWLIFAFPISVVFFIFCWVYLVKIAYPLQDQTFSVEIDEIKNELKSLGKVSYEEKWVILVFSLTAFAWISRCPGELCSFSEEVCPLQKLFSNRACPNGSAASFTESVLCL